jgi:putative ABC transport system substrate-binding protein
VVGFISARSPDESAHLVAAFRRGLTESGLVEGQTMAVEYRWAHGHYERLPAFAAELVQRPVAVLVATGGEPAALAVKAATATIPIVFAIGGDPVKLGLVASYNRPGGNATGISGLTTTLEAKRLGLLRELVPQAGTVGVLLNPNSPQFDSQWKETQQAAQTLSWEIHFVRASTDREMEAAFETISRQRIAALAVAADPFFDTRRNKLVELAAGFKIPTMYQFREYVVAGGLTSYGPNFGDIYREAGAYAAQILKGAKPAELPVLQPTTFELVINLKTAKALGLAVPPSLLARADEVIE